LTQIGEPHGNRHEPKKQVVRHIHVHEPTAYRMGRVTRSLGSC
jgi:hypothetical protein